MLALAEFVRQGCEAVFLLNRAHAPYYKWTLRAMQGLPILSEMATPFAFLLNGENDRKGQSLKSEIVEDICGAIAEELARQSLVTLTDDRFLERYALALQRQIREPSLLSLHLMDG